MPFFTVRTESSWLSARTLGGDAVEAKHDEDYKKRYIPTVLQHQSCKLIKIKMANTSIAMKNENYFLKDVRYVN